VIVVTPNVIDSTLASGNTSLQVTDGVGKIVGGEVGNLKGDVTGGVPGAVGNTSGVAPPGVAVRRPGKPPVDTSPTGVSERGGAADAESCSNDWAGSGQNVAPINSAIRTSITNPAIFVQSGEWFIIEF
jgi:hypothetical protein